MDKLYISPKVKLLLNDKDEDALNALNIFKWQCTESVHQERLPQLANYKIVTYTEYIDHTFSETIGTSRMINNKYYIVFKGDEFDIAMDEIYPETKFTWERFNNESGYEVTSRGDKRFSPFFMNIINPASGELRTLEDFYHLVIKGLEDDDHKSWKDCKGLPPKEGYELDMDLRCTNMYKSYLSKYPGLLYELSVIGGVKVFTDMFGITNNSQARYYCDILNDYYGLD